jgi:hypothetical protein
MSSNTDQCAIAEDGTLLDASEIVFYHDPDDDNPLPNTSSESAVVGSRRSGRVTRPSARVLEANDFEASVSRKRSATVTASIEASVRAARRAKLRVNDKVTDEEESDSFEVDDEDDNDEEDDAMTEEEAVNDATDVEVGYAATKAMGDADRRVSLTFSQISSTND